MLHHPTLDKLQAKTKDLTELDVVRVKVGQQVVVTVDALPGDEFGALHAVDDADEARWRYQRQRGEPVKRERLLVPEHPQHPPLLFGQPVARQHGTEPRHHRLARAQKRDGQRGTGVARLEKIAGQ